MFSEKDMKRKYSQNVMMQLLGLKKRMKAIKAMPELVAMKNERLIEQNRYNKMIDYERLRGEIDKHIPPNHANKEHREKVIKSLFG